MDQKQDAQLEIEVDRIRWENVIFIPFNPIFRFLVVIAVIIKTYLGPLHAIRSDIVCGGGNEFTKQMMFIYRFCADGIYLVDIVLHIAHRQVRDNAVRREYLPKNVILLIMDIISIIPFSIHVSNACTDPVRVWPHILAFMEFLVIYRVVQFFSMVKSHTILRNFIGFSIITYLCLNCLKCWWYLMTTKGYFIEYNYYSINETTVINDWRNIFQIYPTQIIISHNAVRREYLPKNVILLIMDIISIIPFSIHVSNACTDPVRVWPHILAFMEFLVIYRVVQFFSMVKSHTILRNFIGFSIITYLCLNCLKCWWYLMTTKGYFIEYNYYSINETTVINDWRNIFQIYPTQTDFQHQAFHYVATVFFGTSSGMISHFAYRRLLTTAGQGFILMLSFCVKILLLTPKFFAEATLTSRHVYFFQTRVAKILTVVKRRSKSLTLYRDIEKFYHTMWVKRSGTITVPKIINELPKYLIMEVKEDLFWPVFYHSPTFRRTTPPYKRWLSGTVNLEFKMPGDKFHSGPHCNGHLYYIKSGIVQILSSDDKVTPILSVTSGTVFGDINFILPALNPKVTARCVTYCEINYISRADILRSLHLFAEDRRMIMQRARERIKHARQLYNLKQSVKDIDRSEDEGIAWLKRRWWQLNQLHLEPKSASASKLQDRDIPPEENAYHCSKYIGQIVLFSEMHLHNRSIFLITNFPWILAPDSIFLLIWNIVVKTTVILVLFVYPPMLRNLNPNVGMGFISLQFLIDLIYIADIVISLVTYIKKDENPTSLVTTTLERFKSKKLFMDLMSTCLLEHLVKLMGKQKFQQLFKFTRLIKLYIFFEGTNFDKRDFTTDPFVRVTIRSLILVFSYIYIGAFFVYLLTQYFDNLRIEFLFCNFHEMYLSNGKDEPSAFNVLKVWLVSIPYSLCVGQTAEEVYTMVMVIGLGFLIVLYVNGNLMSALYFKHRDIIDFQFATNNLIKEFIHYSIHPKLMKRLHKYILCHWKTANHTHNLKDEPYSVYHTMHDQIAQKIIHSSRAFAGADRDLVKELAHRSKFMIVPQKSTLFLLGMQCDIVSWGVNGVIMYEYSDLDGNSITREFPLGEMISCGSVFFGNIAIRTYTTLTDYEIVYLSVTDFWDILNRYPFELEHIRICQREVMPVHEMLLTKYIYRNINYRRELLESRTKSIEFYKLPSILDKLNDNFCTNLWAWCWIRPNSRFTKRWMGFRTMAIMVSILSWCSQGGVGATYRGQLTFICHLCDFITLCDICIKLFMGYFNEFGIIIHSKKMCIKHYLTRNFFVDLVGMLPWYKFVGEHFTSSQNLLVMTLSRTPHLYIFSGYFDFIGHRPDGSYVTMMIMKLQIIGMFMIILGAQVEVVRCIDMTWGAHYRLLNMTVKDPLCFRDKKFKEEIPLPQFNIFFAHCILDAQGAFLRTVSGVQKMVHLYPLLFIVSSVTNLVYWFIFISCCSLLISKFRGNSVYEDGLNQLKSFLEGERVEKPLVKRAISYFTYLRYRTHGVGKEEQNASDKYGFILKQDISYYFCRKTFAELSKLIALSPNTRKMLATSAEIQYFEPGEDIMREMDVVPYVYIVHRGQVAITRKNTLVHTLLKGSIFGQLWGYHQRPVKVTARTEVSADVLIIPYKRFQEIITDQTKMNIQSFDEADFDYIPSSKYIKENPYNSIEYLTKGAKTIKLPWMKTAVCARKSKWYANWLLLTWLVEPATSAAISTLFTLDMDKSTKVYFFVILGLLDVIHLVYTVTDFLYTLNLIVMDKDCVLIQNKLQRHVQWSFVADLLTMIPPYISVFTNIQFFQLARIVRLRYMNSYNKYFCTNNKFQNELRSLMYRLVIILLCGHFLCCLYIKGVCEGSSKKKLKGRLTSTNETTGNCIFVMDRDVTERHWYHYYVFSLGSLITRNAGLHFAGDDTIDFETNMSIFFEIFINYGLYVIDLILTSKVVCNVFVKLRKLYQYDYSVRQLTHYLSDTGVSPVLLKVVKRYTSQLWERQKGSWIPELAHQTPQCLREDIMSSLYLHHLLGPMLFRNVPHYFLRQVAARFRRIVIFPEKHIVKTGDILPYVFFINEGEVEKYYLDSHTGERKLMSLLTTNGHFGVFPGMFPNTPFQCGYYTRTVVDLVYLRSEDWQTLLQSYPRVQKIMYESARQMGVELGVHDAFFG